MLNPVENTCIRNTASTTPLIFPFPPVTAIPPRTTIRIVRVM